MPSLLNLLPILVFLPLTITHPTTDPCSQPIGLPGSFYMCRGFDWTSTNAYCTWVPPSLTSSCYTFQGDRRNRPFSIGPDPGGHCDLFFAPKCDGWKVKVPSEGWDERTASLKCPGCKDPGLSSPYNSIRCYPDKGM